MPSRKVDIYGRFGGTDCLHRLDRQLRASLPVTAQLFQCTASFSIICVKIYAALIFALKKFTHLL